MTEVIGQPRQGVINLWWTKVPPSGLHLDPWLANLSSQERERAARFKVDGPRYSYIVAHTMLRATLGQASGYPPAELRFATGEHGKPFLLHPRSPLRFNLSHSGTTIVLAMCHDRELGIDVEELRPRASAEHLARRFFSPAEADYVAACRGDAKLRSFFHLWTIKEAYLKAVGSGITVPLHMVEADPNPRRPLRLTRLGEDRNTSAQWSLLRPQLDPDVMCTVAIKARGWKLEVQRWEPPSAAKENSGS